MNQGFPATISLARNEAHKEKAMHFITEVIAEKYHCGRPPLPEFLFTATRGETIIGSIALDFGDSKHPVLLQKIYRFDEAKTPWKFPTDHVSQYTRWAAKTPGISIALMYVSACYGLKRQRDYTLCEVKGGVETLLRRLGVDIRPIQDATLAIEHVPQSILPYYLESPAPILNMVSLRQMRDTLREKVTALVKEKKIFLHEDDLAESVSQS